MNASEKIWILGVGNTLRGDDGAGGYVCDRIEALNLLNVFTQKVQQLQVELLEAMTGFDKILIVDAAINRSYVEIEPVGDTSQPVTGTHHSDPVIFKSLAKRLYKKNLQIFTCAIPAQSFDMEEGLTELAKENAEKAVNLIKDWCCSGKNSY